MFTAEQLRAIESQPGACPGLVEGSDSYESDAVVVRPASVASGDHAGPGDVLGTLTVGQLVDWLADKPADMPVRLSVLDEIIDTAGVECSDQVLIYGAEVVE